MKRISSPGTFFHKRVIPLLWFGCLTFVAISWSFRGAYDDVISIVIFTILLVGGFASFKILVFDLVDEAWDAGDYLIFKNKGIEERVQLENIINVSSWRFVNPPRVTLTLQTPSRLGKWIVFSPPVPWNPFKKFPIVDELIKRADRARSR